MRIAIAGSSGLIGSALARSLAGQGHEVVRLVRHPPAPGEIRWDPTGHRLDPADLDGTDAVVNLAGQGVAAARWSPAQKQAIRDSRVLGNRLLAETIASIDHGPRMLMVGSAIGFYGDTGTGTADESSPNGDDFLASVCVDLEGSTTAASDHGCRVVHARTGIVLSPDGGALGQILPFFKAGIGGRIGDGRQFWSWISIADEIAALTHLLDSDIEGPVNLVSPEPVTNAEFTRTLGRVLHRPTILPTPKVALWIRLGRELTDALLYTSTRVTPGKLLSDGFKFRDIELEAGLRAMLDGRGPLRSRR